MALVQPVSIAGSDFIAFHVQWLFVIVANYMDAAYE